MYRSTSFSINTNGMSFTKRLSLSWTTLSGTIEARAWMRPSEEESKVELPLEGYDVEEKFILGKEIKKYLKQK